MELDDEVYRQIEILTNEGNGLQEKGEFDKAINVFLEALTLLPEPKEVWDAYFWINVAIGDVYFEKNEYMKSLDFFLKASKNPLSKNNPFISLRLGQLKYEFGDVESAKVLLKRAYSMEGMEMFKYEDVKYRNLLH